MNTIIKSSLLTTFLFQPSLVLADNNYTFGLGMGHMYSGVFGINAGIQSDVDIKYVSAGFMVLSTDSKDITYGAGIGWITTDIFDFQTNKHGINLYLGIIAAEESSDSYDPVYGGALGYSYFFRGIEQPGFNIGFNLVSDGNRKGVFFQSGYQF